MTPDAAALYAAVEATWPPLSTTETDGWTLRDGAGGGKRVSAATANAASPQIGPDLVMVREGETALDARLADAGYAVVDPVTIYLGKARDIARPIPPVSGFHVDWPPLLIQHDLWDEGGIGPTRRAVMDRAQGPKVALMGRTDDLPAGTAFAAAHQDIAMVHALEVRPSLRRRGVAVNIMRAAAYWAQDQGVAWLAVLVTQANSSANPLYLGLGLQPVGHYHYRAAPSHAV